MQIPDDPQLRKLVAALGEETSAGFFCLETEERKGYQVVDLGKYEITFSSSGFQKTLYVDGHNYVSDGRAFAEVQDAIFALSAVFGHSFDWGPYGISTVPADAD